MSGNGPAINILVLCSQQRVMKNYNSLLSFSCRLCQLRWGYCTAYNTPASERGPRFWKNLYQSLESAAFYLNNPQVSYNMCLSTLGKSKTLSTQGYVTTVGPNLLSILCFLQSTQWSPCWPNVFSSNFWNDRFMLQP